MYDTEKTRNLEAELNQRLKDSSHRMRMDSKQRSEENMKW